MPDILIAGFEQQWKFARGLTRDLLRVLEPSELLFSPSGSLGQMWKHFRHLGRVQESYLKALKTGVIVFGVEGGTYRGGASRQPLLEYLARLDRELEAALDALDPTAGIDWFGQRVETQEHLRRMAGHEILHHGMFIAYMRLLNKTFPPSWAEWGEA